MARRTQMDTGISKTHFSGPIGLKLSAKRVWILLLLILPRITTKESFGVFMINVNGKELLVGVIYVRWDQTECESGPKNSKTMGIWVLDRAKHDTEPGIVDWNPQIVKRYWPIWFKCNLQIEFWFLIGFFPTLTFLLAISDWCDVIYHSTRPSMNFFNSFCWKNYLKY